MARGVNGNAIYIDDADRMEFLETIARVKTDSPFFLLAFCLMANHFHFAIKVDQAPLSQIMQRLLTDYALSFNRRHDRQGHLFQARYKAINCHDDAYLAALIRYIHENPVRASLCERAEDWLWSSASSRSFAVPEIVDSAVIQNLSPDGSAPFDPWPRLSRMPVLMRQESLAVVPIDELAQRLFDAGSGALRSESRIRAITEKRRVLAREALAAGHSLVSVARWFHCSVPSVHRLVRRKGKQAKA